MANTEPLRNVNRLIKLQNVNVSWRRRAKSNNWLDQWRGPEIEHRKSCLVLSARFPVVNWRSSPVAKSAQWNDDSTLILKETRRTILSQKGFQDVIKSIQWKFFRHSASENWFSTSPNKLYLETEKPVLSAFFLKCSNSITHRVAACYVMSTVQNLLKQRR